MPQRDIDLQKKAQDREKELRASSVSPASTTAQAQAESAMKDEEIARLNQQLESAQRKVEALTPKSSAVSSQTVTHQTFSPSTLNPPTESNGLKCTEKLADDGVTLLYVYEMEGYPPVVTRKKLEELTFEDMAESNFSLYDNAPNRLPQNLTIEFKDPQWAGHWFNRKSRDGYRVDRAMNQLGGWQPAKRSDLKYCLKGLKDTDGAVEDGDLVLLKIPKWILFAQCKEWMDEARRRGGINRFAGEAAGPLSPRQQSKIDFYISDQAQQELSDMRDPFGSALGPVVQHWEMPRGDKQERIAQSKRQVTR